MKRWEREGTENKRGRISDTKLKSDFGHGLGSPKTLLVVQEDHME